MYKRPDGKWRSDVRINGKRYQKVWDTINEKKAKKLEKDWRELMEKIHADSPSATLAALLSPSAVNKPMKLSEASDWMYDRVWKLAEDSKNPPSRMRTLIKLMGDVDITTITTEDLLKLKHRMLVEGVDGLVYTPKTFNHLLSALSSTMDMLEAVKAAKMITRPNFKKLRATYTLGRNVCFSDEAMSKMLNYFKDKYAASGRLVDLQLIEFFIINSNLGLRPAEFFVLQVGDVDLENKTVTINKALKTHSRNTYTGETKNGVSRTLPIDGLCFETLKVAVERIKIAKRLTRAEAAELYADEKDETLKRLYGFIAEGLYENIRGIALEHCPLFRLNMAYCGCAWKMMAKSLGGAKEYTMYGLRHTAASRLVTMRGFNAHKVMRFLGHRSIITSLRYVHLNVDDLRDGCEIGVTE